MFENRNFKKEELKVSDLQYLVSHDTTLKFKIGDIVFLKSSPEIPLEVVDVNMKKVYCKFDRGIIKLYPQMILHYKDAGLMVFKKEYIISLN